MVSYRIIFEAERLFNVIYELRRKTDMSMVG